MPRGTPICVLCAAAFLVAAVEGQTYHAFQWKFGNNYVEQDFKECQTLPIIVESLTTSDSSALGVPPYYLVAFEVGSIPTTSMIGSDAANLSWTANHSRGSSLMLSLMDSNGSTGGVPPNLYSMNPGSDTSCLPSPPSTQSASVHPNVTDTITTCQPWGLTIKDGKKPYTVVLAALNSPVITNVTMGDDDDVFTYINRADPNGELMASVVDATGQWGISSNITRTAGSTDVDCVGLVSSSKASAEIAQEALDRARAASDADRRRRTRLIVGLTVGLGVPIVAGLALVAWLFYRQKQPQNEQGIWDNQDTTPRPLELPSAGDMREVDTAPLSSKSSAFASYTPAGSPGIEVTPIPPVYFDREIAEAHQRTRSADAAASNPTSGGAASGAPSASLVEASARYRKAMQAARGLYTTLSPSPSAQTSVQSLHGLPVTPRPARPRTATPPALFNASLDPDDIQPDIIIQHRDGGVVQELPPPYADRSAEMGPPPPISPLEAPPSSASAGSNTPPSPPPPTHTA